VAVQGGVETGDSMKAIALQRVNLAVQHMLAAARFSRDVGELERDHENQPFGGFWESIFHSAIACVLTTVASLEAYANELFSDRITVFPEYSHDLLHNLWDTYERKPMLDKFDLHSFSCASQYWFAAYGHVRTSRFWLTFETL
jgi:hypothetical protein